MKKVSIIFLQVVVALIGLGVLIFMLWEPHLEGRNVNATVFEIYFKDLFLAYAYTASIAFFTAIYQTIKLLQLIKRNEIFSEYSVKALQIIKYCAVIIICFVSGALAYLVIVRPEEDITGGVAMGLFIIIISTIVTASASVFKKVIQDGMGKISSV